MQGKHQAMTPNLKMSKVSRRLHVLRTSSKVAETVTEAMAPLSAISSDRDVFRIAITTTTGSNNHSSVGLFQIMHQEGWALQKKKKHRLDKTLPAVRIRSVWWGNKDGVMKG